MKVENKIFNSTDSQINGLADETISLLKKLIMMLQPLSFLSTPIALRLNTSFVTSQVDNITIMTNISGTIPTITSINQLGGVGIGNVNLNSASIINNTPFAGGFDFQIGDIVILSGGASVVVYDIYDGNISNIDIIPISGGTGYISGEIVSIDNGINGKIQIMSVDNSGMAVEIAILEPGYGYNVGVSQQISSTGSGSGLIVNITSIKLGIGAAKFVSLLSGGLNYIVGDYPQIQTNNFGFGLVVSVLNTNTDNGNTNFLQFDESRWLYSDMIRNNLTF